MKATSKSFGSRLDPAMGYPRIDKGSIYNSGVVAGVEDCLEVAKAHAIAKYGATSDEARCIELIIHHFTNG